MAGAASMVAYGGGRKQRIVRLKIPGYRLAGFSGAAPVAIMVASNGETAEIEDHMKWDEPPTRQTTSRRPVVDYVAGQFHNYSIHEALPMIPSAHAYFFEAEKFTADILTLLKQIFPTHQTHNKAIAAVLRDLKPASYGRALKIGVVGSTGVGKSTAVNAILGHWDLAPAGGAGHVVSQVVTEYIDSGPGKKGFRTEIYFKDKKTIFADIEKFVFDFQKYFQEQPNGNDLTNTNVEGQYQERVTRNDSPMDADAKTDCFGCDDYVDQADRFDNINDEAEDLDDDASVEDDVSQRLQFGTARTYLTHAFGTAKGFESKAALAKTLAKLPQDDLARITKSLQKIAEKRISDLTSGNLRMYTVAASDEVSLKSAIQPFTEGPQSADAQVYWPFVDRVRVFFDSPLLRQGLILADVPGLSDGNATRRDAAIDYLEHCDILLIFVNSERALDISAWEPYVHDYRRFGRSGRLIIVPTRCDEMACDPSGEEVSPKDRVRLTSLQQAIDRAKSQSGDSARRWLETLKFKQKKERIRIFMETLPTAIQNEFTNRGSFVGKLDIIPTTSRGYEHWLQGGNPNEALLPIGRDGIGDLRSALCMFAHARRDHILSQYLTTNIGHWIQQIERALNNSSNKHVGTLLKQVGQQCSRIAESSVPTPCQLSNILSQRAKPHLRKVLLERNSRVRRTLDKLVGAEWPRAHPNGKTFQAFAAHNGVHRPRPKKYQRDKLYNKNHEIMKILKLYIDKVIPILGSALRSILEGIHTDVYAAIEGLYKQLNSNENLTIVEKQSLLDSCKMQRTALQSTLDCALSNVIVLCEDVVKRCTSEQQMTKYSQGMKKVWEGARQKGSLPGRTFIPKMRLVAQRWKFIRDVLLDDLVVEHIPNPLKILHDELEDGLTAAIATLQFRIKEAVEVPFTVTTEVIQAMFPTNSNDPREKAWLKEAKARYAAKKDHLSATINQVQLHIEAARADYGRRRSQRYAHAAEVEENPDLVARAKRVKLVV
ncbi:hypothetical protein K461DRAFT_322295 [Myriangium duriaei CBS 260.36]|uniref:Dynamin N-terminal domain-containing protein n=1 Tax=Myriangium duriaei CBS 260.36 TaxID=1168546 RepID=A0A9P4MEA9_9PEZI|nr:hypothetical protein K461DRAFT_322295 [Myriangium duriaei CBS 260.36]